MSGEQEDMVSRDQSPSASGVREPADRTAYRESLAQLEDDAFVKATEMQIWLSAFANNNPRAPAHWKSDAAYDEAARREKIWLYQRAWNAACRSCGYEPSKDEIERANAPTASPAERSERGPGTDPKPFNQSSSRPLNGESE